jgi:hypothetical protein
MRWLLITALAATLWTLPLVSHATPTQRDVSKGSHGAQRDRKKAKAKPKPKAAPAAPEWSWSKGPFTHFAWLARQLPDFARFPSSTREIRLSIVAHREKSLLFLDSCLAKEKAGKWQVSKCNAVALDEKQLLSRLVRAGTDTSASPTSLDELQTFLASVRKTARKEDLLPLLLKASVENKDAYRLLDDIDADLKECGTKRFFKALGSLPKATYIGPNVVVIDLSYTVEKGSSSFKLKTSLAKTKAGWRVGGLQLKCF